REAENPVIQTRFETSNGCPSGQGGDKHFCGPGRLAQSECATGSGQHQNFGEQLPKDALLRGAERQPDRYFTPPSLPPYTQQAGQIRARDQQNETYHRSQKKQRLFRIELHNRASVRSRIEEQGPANKTLFVGSRALGQRPLELEESMVKRLHSTVCLSGRQARF